MRSVLYRYYVFQSERIISDPQEDLVADIVVHLVNGAGEDIRAAGFGCSDKGNVLAYEGVGIAVLDGGEDLNEAGVHCFKLLQLRELRQLHDGLRALQRGLLQLRGRRVRPVLLR